MTFVKRLANVDEIGPRAWFNEKGHGQNGILCPSKRTQRQSLRSRLAATFRNNWRRSRQSSMAQSNGRPRQHSDRGGQTGSWKPCPRWSPTLGNANGNTFPRQGRTLARMSHCWTLFWTTSPARSGNTTSLASISKAYIPKLEVGDYMQAKMVDYYLTLAGGDTMSLAKKRNKVNRSVSINHTSYEPVQDQPIAVNIETKTPGSSKTEAEAQLSV